MAKKDKKTEIIRTAAELFHQRGYYAVGLNEILEKAEIPKGSFYHYFKSKDDLLAQVTTMHLQDRLETFMECEPDIAGLRSFFKYYFGQAENDNFIYGCPVGNLMLEVASSNEEVRNIILTGVNGMQEAIGNILCHSLDMTREEAIQLSLFILSNFQGAMLHSKLRRDKKPVEEFDEFIFGRILSGYPFKNV